jgi:hypothetical protein
VVDSDPPIEGAVFVMGQVGAQVVLVADGAGFRVDDTDRVVVVVGHDQRFVVVFCEIEA